jgi:hypothetical protein
MLLAPECAPSDAPIRRGGPREGVRGVSAGERSAVLSFVSSGRFPFCPTGALGRGDSFAGGG